MASIIGLWWLPVASIFLLAMFAWLLKRKLSNNMNKHENEKFMTIGILVAIAGAMFPSVTGTAEPLLTAPRVVFILIIVAIVGISTSIVIGATRKKKSPNQAL